jgi:putative DNA primase/helicase
MAEVRVLPEALDALRRAMPSTWPEPEPIGAELPPVDAITPELLPESFRSLVMDVAERMQVPMDYPAAIMVLCLAGAVNRRASIWPKVRDSSWTVIPNLWGGIVAPPGLLKSPLIGAVTRPLTQIESDWHREHKSMISEYERAKEECELRNAAWREQYKSASKKGSVAPKRPECGPAESKPRRLIVHDATMEKLHEIMADNPAGVLVMRDELTGWLTQLNRQGREGERAFSLSAWNGDTEHTIDRIGRGSIHVAACCMSLLGGIQPSRLRSYLVDALHDGPANDGLIQRFQVVVWPDAPMKWEYVDLSPDAEALERAGRVFRRLVEMDAENPVRLRFAPDAQELFVAWLADLEAKIRAGELHPSLVAHLAKYRSLMPSLSGLFHLADWAAGNCDSGLVSLQRAAQGAAWCDYLESHARRMYSGVITPRMRAAQELADKIKDRKIGADGWIVARHVYRHGWSGLDSPETVRQAAEVLMDAGWLRDASTNPGPAGGCPSARYEVNPRVWGVS